MTAAPDPLAAAVDHPAADLISRVEELRVAAASDGLTALSRARVLVALSDATDQLDTLLDRLGGIEGLMPEGDG